MALFITRAITRDVCKQATRRFGCQCPSSQEIARRVVAEWRHTSSLSSTSISKGVCEKPVCSKSVRRNVKWSALKGTLPIISAGYGRPLVTNDNVAAESAGSQCLDLHVYSRVSAQSLCSWPPPSPLLSFTRHERLCSNTSVSGCAVSEGEAGQSFCNTEAHFSSRDYAPPDASASKPVVQAIGGCEPDSWRLRLLWERKRSGCIGIPIYRGGQADNANFFRQIDASRVGPGVGIVGRGGGGGGSIRSCIRPFTSGSDDRLLQRAKGVMDKRAKRLKKESLRASHDNEAMTGHVVAEGQVSESGAQGGATVEQPAITQPLVGPLVPRTPLEEKLVPIFARSDLIITRNIEWANIAFGFEQANRYVIIDQQQAQKAVGYIYEESNIFARQILRSRRPFVAHVLDAQGNEICRVRRPAFLINSSVYIEVDDEVVGEAHSRWHLWKRVYDVYIGKKQFAAVENPGFWNWTFTLEDENNGVIAAIDRNWRGIGYEFMTDAGQYVVRFGDVRDHVGVEDDDETADRTPLATGSNDENSPLIRLPPGGQPSSSSVPDRPPETSIQNVQDAGAEVPQLQVVRPLNLLERAVALALAVSLDNDYFSRHSGSMGGFPIPFFPSAQSEEADSDDTEPQTGGGTVGGALGGVALGEAMSNGSTSDEDLSGWQDQTTLSGERLPSDDDRDDGSQTSSWGFSDDGGEDEGDKFDGGGEDQGDNFDDGDGDGSSIWGTLSDIFDSGGSSD